jgi:5-amino-6-(D-ribitylamino)uracil---L-tyrosine 4-hydroxyphenyl transferase
LASIKLYISYRIEKLNVIFMGQQEIVQLIEEPLEIFSKIPMEILERVYAGISTKEDSLELIQCEPQVVFKLADYLRTDLVGNNVTYIVNRNINFSDQCIGTCSFCAFKDYSGFILTTPEIVEKSKKAVLQGATEVCIQGALMNDMFLEDYCEILEGIKSRFPKLHIHAFSPMEVFHMSRNSGIMVEEALEALKHAGLDTMPGTAAEILSDRVRREICPDKITSSQWIDVVRAAHNTGIPTTATMMYGHIETMEERIEHILLIRDLQVETGGFTEFVPLSFMPYNNPLGERLLAEGRYATTGVEDLMVHALARILLYPHVKNIQASWVKLGKKLAQYALFCGANDLGGTLMEEKISKSAGASNGEYMPPDEFEWIIKGAGKEPVQRDTLYRSVISEKEFNQ